MKHIFLPVQKIRDCHLRYRASPHRALMSGAVFVLILLHFAAILEAEGKNHEIYATRAVNGIIGRQGY